MVLSRTLILADGTLFALAATGFTFRTSSSTGNALFFSVSRPCAFDPVPAPELTTSLPFSASPTSATPPLPNTGCGCSISLLVRCSNCVGSCASGCGTGLFRRGPDARPPMKFAREIGSGFDDVPAGVVEGLRSESEGAEIVLICVLLFN